MNQIEIQTVFESPGQPDHQSIQRWIDAALEEVHQDTEIVIRIVDEPEMTELNERYRHKQGATNILSFPFEVPEGIHAPEDGDMNLLGDLVICAPVLKKEAREQHKNLDQHWAHIIVHGVLHLLGYDHIDDNEAEAMENKEIAILHKLNIENPYSEVNDI
jgi:probable rRNA maturation factor